MRSSFIIILLTLSPALAFSQGKYHSNFYNFDPKLLNPAFAGMTNEQDYQVQFAARSMNIENYPLGGLTAFSTQLSQINSGIGAISIVHRVGSSREINHNLLYNYQFKFGDTKCLSIGTQIGYYNLTIDYSDTDLKEDLPDEHDQAFNGDIGIAFRNKKFNIGISTSNLFRSNYADHPTLANGRLLSVFLKHEFTIASWLELQPAAVLTDYLNDESEYDVRFLDINVSALIGNLVVVGTAAQFYSNDHYQRYYTGIDLKKKFQFLVTVYSAAAREYSSKRNVEAMLRFRVANK